MSYILDALKKSERERPPGPVPDLFTVHGPQPPSPRWPTRAIVALALLLAVPVTALLIWIGTDRRDEDSAQTPVAASPQLRAEDSTAPVTSLTVAAPAPTATARAAAAKRRPFDERSQPPAPPAHKPRGADASSVIPAAVPAAPPDFVAPPASGTPDPVRVSAVVIPMPRAPISMPPVPVISASSAMPLPPQTGAEVASAPAPIPEMPPAGIPAAPPVTSPEPLPAVSASEQAPPADGRVLDLTELPAPIRAELPKLLVSGHVWSEEPSLRLLSVDDRLLHEGGEAAPGVSLQEITPAGAVFVYKGWHFRVAGRRP